MKKMEFSRKGSRRARAENSRPLNKRFFLLGTMLSPALFGMNAADALPAGPTTCTGVCGTAGADGVVTAPPTGSTYTYVVTKFDRHGETARLDRNERLQREIQDVQRRRRSAADLLLQLRDT